MTGVQTCALPIFAAARALDDDLAAGRPVGPLAGVPLGIKDIVPTAGIRTTYGSPLYADYVPMHDALHVQRLKAAGAIVVGKTNTPEFAAGANTFNAVFGATRNPWNTALSASGSTGGGAAALAAGMIALSDGTDLGGSLRTPAAFCGVVGLRPSVGLVPRDPTASPWQTLSVAGPMARTVADAALMLQALAGPHPLSVFAAPVEGRDFVAAARAGLRSTTNTVSPRRSSTAVNSRPMNPFPTTSTRPGGTCAAPRSTHASGSTKVPRASSTSSGSSTQPCARTRSAKPPGTIVGSGKQIGRAHV